MWFATMTQPDDATSVTNIPKRLMLWIDGVGAYLLCLKKEVTIGGPMQNSSPSEISLMANLSRCHATIIRDGESYFLEAHSPVHVDGRRVDWRTHLTKKSSIQLGENVQLQFRLPSVLSQSALLQFVSHHRPSFSVDGVVLMDENCLLGPGKENHIQCAQWEESLLLYIKGDNLYCKSHGDMFIDGEPATGASIIKPGQTVSGEEWRFRLETV